MPAYHTTTVRRRASDEDNSVILQRSQTAVIDNSYITVILLFLTSINNFQHTASVIKGIWLNLFLLQYLLIHQIHLNLNLVKLWLLLLLFLKVLLLTFKK